MSFIHPINIEVKEIMLLGSWAESKNTVGN